MVFHRIECYILSKLNKLELHVPMWIYHKILVMREKCVFVNLIRKHGTLMEFEDNSMRRLYPEA